jgi:GNAT superfamily N-acetyltransferase
VLGTADTPAFARWFRDVWLPPLARRRPAPTGWDEVMTTALHSPERLVRPELTGYPAHLHINLLPEYQRRGLGRRLMWTFLDALHRRGVPAVHLAYAKVNIPGRQFYKRLGFEPLDVADPDPVRYVGRSTSTVDAP